MRGNARFYILIFFIFIITATTPVTKQFPLRFVKLSDLAEASVSKTEGIYSITFEQLEQARKYINKKKKEEDITCFPEELLKLNGKMVKITGNLLIPSEQYYMNEPLATFAVSKNAFGCPCCTWGPPPTVFNSILVTLKKGVLLDPPYSQCVDVSGIFRVAKMRSEDGQLCGLFYITNATVLKVKKSIISSIF